MKLFNSLMVPFGVNLAPNTPIPKCDPWSAAIGATASHINTGLELLFNKSNVDATNEANLEMTRMNNETQKLLAREANAMSQAQFNTNLQWLKEQFYKQREYALDERAYQSIDNQVRRLLAAGINPAYYFGNGSMATPSVSSVGAPSQSQFHVAQTEAGHIDPFLIDLDGLSESVGSAVNAFYDNQLKNEQTKKVSYESLVERANAATQFQKNLADLREQYVRIDKLLADKDVSKATKERLESEKAQLDQSIKFMADDWNELLRRDKVNNDFTVEQTEESRTRQVLNRIDAQLKPALASAQINLSNAQAASANASLPLIVEQIANAKREGHILNTQFVRNVVENQLLKSNAEWQQLKNAAKTSSKAAKCFYGTIDLFTETILGNLRLFGK